MLEDSKATYITFGEFKYEIRGGGFISWNFEAIANIVLWKARTILKLSGKNKVLRIFCIEPERIMCSYEPLENPKDTEEDNTFDVTYEEDLPEFQNSRQK